MRMERRCAPPEILAETFGTALPSTGTGRFVPASWILVKNVPWVPWPGSSSAISGKVRISGTSGESSETIGGNCLFAGSALMALKGVISDGMATLKCNG
jgi:hypothetical protein